MREVVILIWIVHGICMAIDEFYFHRRRGLGRWERWGHSVDTVIYLCTFIIAILAPPTSFWQTIWISMAVCSSLVITKDEWIHRRVATGGEMWIHAILFILHPIALAGVYMLWRTQEMSLLWTQAVVVALFMVYQFVYWNLLTRRKAV